MEFIYKNIFGRIITYEEAQALGPKEDYSKETFENGALKRVDYFYDNKLDAGVYYLSDSESLIDLVEQLSAIWRDGTFYYDRKVIRDFSIWKWEIYKGLELVERGIGVYDSEFREIAYQQLNLSGDAILKTIKFYHLSNYESFGNDPDMPGSGVLEFNYPSNGRVDVHIGLNGFERKVYAIKEDSNKLLHPMITSLFSWEDNEYYHQADPLVPIS